VADHYVDPREVGGGNDSNNGSTFALRKKSFASVSPSAGDNVRVVASDDPVRAQGLNGTNANGTFTNKDDDIPISETFCKIVHECDAAWTAAANVTAATTATFVKAGTNGALITVAAGFTTGIAAYVLTANADYSNCDRLSFWLYQTAGAAIPASTLSVRLCSDTVGAVVVDEFVIPHALLSGGGNWVPVELTRTGGGNLGASIQSISVAFSSDPTAVAFALDNIIATNAFGITHQCWVTKDSSATGLKGDPVRAIAPTNIKTDADMASLGTTAKRGYSGTTETVAIYFRKPLLCYAQQAFPAGGSLGSTVNWSGGWDPTAMNSQTAITILPRIATISSRSYHTVEKIIFSDNGSALQIDNCTGITLNYCGGSRATNGLLISGTSTDIAINNCNFTGNTTGISVTAFMTRMTFTDNEAYGNTTGYSLTTISATAGTSLTGCIANNNVTGFALPGLSEEFPLANCIAKDNTTGFQTAAPTGAVILNPTTAGNTTMIALAQGSNDVRFFGGTYGESESALASGSTASRVRFSRFNNDQGDERERSNQGWVRKVAAAGWNGTGHTPTGSVWKMTGSGSNVISTNPLVMLFSPGPLAVGSYTVTIQAYRTNANCTGKLVVKGGRTDGIPTDVSSAAISAAINTNEELTVSFDVDTEGPVYMEFHKYFTSGSTGEVWFDLVGGI
jgi:hypothetical protein